MLDQAADGHHRPVGVVGRAAREPLEVDAELDHVQPPHPRREPLDGAAVVLADEHREGRLLQAAAQAGGVGEQVGGVAGERVRAPGQAAEQRGDVGGLGGEVGVEVVGSHRGRSPRRQPGQPTQRPPI